MKYISKSLALPLVIGAMLVSTQAQSATPWIRASGQVNYDVNAADSNDFESKLRAQDAELKLELMLREGIKIVIKAELEKQLNGKLIKNIDIDKMIEEAYIQIETDKFGLPRATITLGKHAVAFGQNISELPMFKDALLYDLAHKDEVIGLTVALPVNFFKIVDTVALSVFEAGEGDFKISKEKGASMKLSKKITQQLEAQISYMMKQNSGGKDEHRGSVGFVYTDAQGNWKVYAEGIITRANPISGDTWGATVGGSYKVGPGAVVVEYSYLNDFAHEIAVAYNLPVGKNLVLSPEIRHRMDLDGNDNDDTVIGLRARLKFETESAHTLQTGRKK